MAKIDPMPQINMSSGVTIQNFSKKYRSEKKLEGGPILEVSKIDDVIRWHDVITNDEILSEDVNP